MAKTWRMRHQKGSVLGSHGIKLANEHDYLYREWLSREGLSNEIVATSIRRTFATQSIRP